MIRLFDVLNCSYYVLIKHLASTVGSTLNSYLEGQWIESSSGFVSETCLLRRYCHG